MSVAAITQEAAVNAYQIGGVVAIALSLVELVKMLVARVIEAPTKRDEREARKVLQDLAETVRHHELLEDLHQQALERTLRELAGLSKGTNALLDRMDRRLERLEDGS